jgi:uncharacterized protein (DUF305 family)
MVHPGAVVSVLAGDLHAAAALLDRFPGSSFVVIPLFAWLRRSASERKAFGGRTFLRVWSLGTISGVLVLAAAALFAAYDRELPWVGRDPVVDRTFMRHMSTHHDQGILLALIGVERASDPHLRALSKLMAASQRGEAKIFARWWASWFGEPMQICSAEERASMPGLLETADVAKLGSAEASSFDRLFVDLMTKSWRMRSVMNSKGRSRSCAAWDGTLYRDAR